MIKHLKISVSDFQNKINYNFKNLSLLEQAIVHQSYISKQTVAFFERLEFLGDKVLGLAITEKLLNTFPLEDEGKIAVRYTNLTNKDALYSTMSNLHIMDDIELFDDCKTVAVYADIMEAIIGAIFVDSCYDTIRDLIFQWISVNDSDGKNAKNLLQEYLQHKGMQIPKYEDTLCMTNYFEVKVSAEELKLSAVGSGHNKKIAEQDAAKKLLALINEK